MDTESNNENWNHFFVTEIDDEYWDHLLNYVDANYDSLEYALYDDYQEPFNDRLEDA